MFGVIKVRDQLDAIDSLQSEAKNTFNKILNFLETYQTVLDDSTQSEIFWEREFKTALNYLRKGKKQFALNTTNSDVDMFLAKYDHIDIEDMDF